MTTCEVAIPWVHEHRHEPTKVPRRIRDHVYGCRCVGCLECRQILEREPGYHPDSLHLQRAERIV
ncbi:MAG: hypothetical protein HY092_02070 [Candidatus Kerfeldbacteria bacterium]|nr:hypothetical protein [Candidatus Kerfeldbacteria bacterium]